jgi:hypothetical protein
MTGNLQEHRCVRPSTRVPIDRLIYHITILTLHRIQVNLAAETGEMGILANHVPSIEQLKPGLVEVIEESGSKQFFRESWDVGKRCILILIIMSSFRRLRSCPARLSIEHQRCTVHAMTQYSHPRTF